MRKLWPSILFVVVMSSSLVARDDFPRFWSFRSQGRQGDQYEQKKNQQFVAVEWWNFKAAGTVNDINTNPAETSVKSENAMGLRWHTWFGRTLGELVVRDFNVESVFANNARYGNALFTVANGAIQKSETRQLELNLRRVIYGHDRFKLEAMVGLDRFGLTNTVLDRKGNRVTLISDTQVLPIFGIQLELPLLENFALRTRYQQSVKSLGVDELAHRFLELGALWYKGALEFELGWRSTKLDLETTKTPSGSTSITQEYEGFYTRVGTKF